MLSAAVASCHQQKLSQTKQCSPMPICLCYFDRSSLAQEPAWLPAAKLPSIMFGGAPGPFLGFPAWEPPAVHGWMVPDPAINHWLDSMSESTKTNLERCPAELRAKVTASVYTRSHSPQAPVNPEAYLNGAIHREMREGAGKMVGAPSHSNLASPYSGGPPRSQPTCGYVPAPALGRPPASPQQQGARVPRPPWVEEAWALRSSERPFFRFLARVLPRRALQDLPSPPGAAHHVQLFVRGVRRVEAKVVDPQLRHLNGPGMGSSGRRHPTG